MLPGQVAPFKHLRSAPERCCRRLLTEPRAPWPPAGVLRMVATAALLTHLR